MPNPILQSALLQEAWRRLQASAETRGKDCGCAPGNSSGRARVGGGRRDSRRAATGEGEAQCQAQALLESQQALEDHTPDRFKPKSEEVALEADRHGRRLQSIHRRDAERDGLPRRQ